MESNVISILVSSGLSLLISYLTSVRIKLKYDKEYYRWGLKRKACENAMSIVDQVFSRKEWKDEKNGELLRVMPQEVAAIEQIRQCHNELWLSCDNLSVIEIFSKCMDEKKITADLTLDFRNAIRKELGFEQLSLDDHQRNNAWIAFVKFSGKK